MLDFKHQLCPRKRGQVLPPVPSWLEMIKLSKFPAFFGCKSQFVFFCIFFETNTHIKSLYIENDQIWNILQKFTLKGCENSRFLWSAQYFSHQNLCNCQSNIVEKLLILKLYNLADFILALWPLRLLRAFLEKWCVSIKSVCYFNSALLWWFDVRTVEITKGNHVIG